MAILNLPKGRVKQVTPGYPIMADLRSPEDAAIFILSIFVHVMHRRPGDVLQQRSFIGPFSRDGWCMSDFKPGMEFAIDQGWVQIVPRVSFLLTKAGFEKA
jgi:hypothetical protein